MAGRDGDRVSRSGPVPASAPAASDPPASRPPASQAEFSMPFVAGQIINHKYEIVDLIGVGGLGFVVAAIHVELGERVALKFLRPEALTNAEAVGRFAREARASAKINSEHVARVFDVGSLPDGSPFIVMEYLEGSDLSVVLHDRGALPIQLAVEYVLQTCEALAAAHSSGVVHRDIKPENLFLNRRTRGVDSIKVLDFGISKTALARSGFESRHPLVRTTMAMGSPIYMSPEQIRAARDIDARTDIWSLGCVLYELLTNRLAFDAPTLTQITAVILEQETPSLRAACPEAPPGLEAIVRRCLEKNPAQRFQDVSELALALYPYAPVRARVAVERCCSILRSAGMATATTERPGARPPPLPPMDGASPPSADATSTPTLEASVTPPRPRTSGKRWPWGIAALMVLAGALGMFVRAASEMGASSEGAASLPPPAAAPVSAAAPAPSEAPPAAAPAPPPADTPAAEAAPTLADAPPLPSDDSAVPSAEAAPPAEAAPTTLGAEVPPAASGALASAAPRSAAPSPSATPAVASSRAALETSRAKPSGADAPRRRSSTPPPKPKTPTPPRSVATTPDEPDVGF